MAKEKEIIYFGGGCFWCTEAIFKMLKGAVSVIPGYVDEVEVAGVEYNSSEISLHDLLTVFFASHDPTQVDGQGNDIGPRYRSAIFYTAAEQGAEADEFIGELNRSSLDGKPVVTEVKMASEFVPAGPENYNYYARHQENSYCQVVIDPKLAKVQKDFAELLKKNDL